MKFENVRSLMEAKLKDFKLNEYEIDDEDIYDVMELTTEMSLDNAIIKVLTDRKYEDIEFLLIENLKAHDLEGCEITDEDIEEVIELESSMSLNDAVNKVLSDIRDLLDEALEDEESDF